MYNGNEELLVTYPHSRGCIPNWASERVVLDYLHGEGAYRSHTSRDPARPRHQMDSRTQIILVRPSSPHQHWC
jgi:hypothetical protein